MPTAVKKRDAVSGSAKRRAQKKPSGLLCCLRRIFINDKLCDAVSVANVDECHRTQIADFLHPAGKGNSLINIRGS